METTVGFLSRGISFPTVAFGGEGDDTMVVYSNKALLKLFGEEGNDNFVVRAFLIKNTTELATTDTVVNGGAGDDHIEYNINAPLAIDGGEGVDTLVVIGTEASDNFVVTRDGVQGAGLNIGFTGIEKLELDSLTRATLVVAVEDRFRVMLDDDALERVRTAADLCRLVAHAETETFAR